MAGVIPQFYNQVEFSELTQTLHSVIHIVRGLEGTFRAATTAEEIQTAAAEDLVMDELFSPEVVLVGYVYRRMKHQFHKYGARIGASSSHYPSNQCTPMLPAEWLYQPG